MIQSWVSLISLFIFPQAIGIGPYALGPCSYGKKAGSLAEQRTSVYHLPFSVLVDAGALVHIVLRTSPVLVASSLHVLHAQCTTGPHVASHSNHISIDTYTTDGLICPVPFPVKYNPYLKHRASCVAPAEIIQTIL